MKQILISTLLALSSLTALAQSPRMLDGDALSNGIQERNYVKNPSARTTPTFGTATSSAAVARDTSTGANKIDGVASFTCDTSATSGYCEFQTYTIQEADKTGMCEASVVYKGDATLYGLQVYDGSGVIYQSPALTNESDWKEYYALLPCGSTRTVRFTQTTAGTSPAVNLGRVTWKKTNRIGYVAQSYTVGTVKYAGIASCSWSVSAQAFTSFSADTDCSTPTATGKLVAPGTKIPAFILSGPPGDYYIVANGQFVPSGAGGAACHWRFSDGTNSSEISTTQITASTFPNVLGKISYTTAPVSATVNLQAWTAVGGDSCSINNDTATRKELTFTVVYVPTSSQAAITPDENNWYVDASLDATGNLSGATGTAATYIAPSGTATVTLRPNSGSAPVGATCSSTTAATTPTTSTSQCSTAANGTIGISFTIPRIGIYDVCLAYSHGLSTAASNGATINVANTLVETATNAQTSLQEGKEHTFVSVSYEGSSAAQTAVFPRRLCAAFNFTSVGTKAIRLFEEVNVTSGTFANTYYLDVSGSVGQRDMNWTIRPRNGTNLPILVASQSEVRLDTHAGYGSTNTKIERFTNVSNTGTSFTVTQSSTAGDSITVNSVGLYTCSYTFSSDGTNDNYQFGISKNSSQLTTDITGISAADRLAVFHDTSKVNASLPMATVSWTGWLAANDVLRAHTDAKVPSTTSRAVFYCTKVGP